MENLCQGPVGKAPHCMVISPIQVVVSLIIAGNLIKMGNVSLVKTANLLIGVHTVMEQATVCSIAQRRPRMVVLVQLHL